MVNNPATCQIAFKDLSYYTTVTKRTRFNVNDRQYYISCLINLNVHMSRLAEI